MKTGVLIIVAALLSVSLIGGSMVARQFAARPDAQPVEGKAAEISNLKSDFFRGLSADDECCRAVTQGEFAVMLAHGLGLAEPPGGWTESKATVELARIGRSPQTGWESQKPLEESVMRKLLVGSRFAFSQAAVMNQVTVTVARARAVFRDGLPVTQGRFALMLVQAGAAARTNLGQEAGATSERAVLTLVARGIKPSSGWKPDEPLTERVMREVLQQAGLAATLQNRGLPEMDGVAVDLSRAYGILFERKNVITQGMIALLLVKMSGLTAPPGGWTVEAAIAELERFNAQPEFGWVPTAPICQSDLARLARRAGVAMTSTDRCQVVVGQSQLSAEAGNRGPSGFANTFGGVTVPDVPRAGPIFGQPPIATGIRPTQNSGRSGQTPVPVPVPPIIIGPELPSNFSATPPRPRF